MHLLRVVVLCSCICLTGCVTETPQGAGRRPLSYEEVRQETLFDAVVSQKRQAARFGAYHISAWPIAQVSPDCWTVHQVIRKYDRVDAEQDVRVCRRDGKLYTTTSSP
jgi:hypothetical protein